MECPVEIQFHLSLDYPVWSLLVPLSVGMLSFSCVSHSQPSCQAQPTGSLLRPLLCLTQTPEAFGCSSLPFHLGATGLQGWSFHLEEHWLHQCSINNFVYQGIRENKFSHSKMQDFIECQRIPKEYIFFSFSNPLCFSPSGPWNIVLFAWQLFIFFFTCWATPHT